MKSLTAVCPTGASMPPINANGRVSRPPHQRGDGENAEMKMYLSKLKDLVPFMPKNRKLSKLEIIQHVIDYICDLQTELETHPDIGNFDAASALNLPTTNGELLQQMVNGEDMLAERLAAEQQHEIAQQQQQQQQQHSSPATRQPLVDRPAPNTILPVNGHTSAGIIQALQMQQLQQQHQQQQQQQQSLAAMQQNSETTTATEKDSRQAAC